MGYIRDDVTVYIKGLENEFITGIAREHSYRPALKELIESFNDDITVVNGPKRPLKDSAPDFLIQDNNGIQIGYIETKDVDKNLDHEGFKKQFDRYRDCFDNLIITNYLTFKYYLKGECVYEAQIAEIRNGAIKAIKGSDVRFTDLIKDFVGYKIPTTKTASELAERLASKARVLSDNIKDALDSDDKEQRRDSAFQIEREEVRKKLIKNITNKDFGDLYAQTIAYGMFTARLHDPESDSFTRNQAAELIPKTNPFLRKFFQTIAGFDLDERIIWPVDALANILRCTDIKCLLKDFKTVVGKDDPFIHFYETFLAEYDPSLRKSRGVWYTPESVVSFIVRSIDDILKADFNIPRGLADESNKVVVKKDQKEDTVEKQIHKIQILDPATGTGTFLAEIVKHIYNNYFKGQEGMWADYVNSDLIPRLNGFEILMTSYTMAHIKLEMLLKDTGYESKSDNRFRIYLNNSLEEYDPSQEEFADILAKELIEANQVKDASPVMIVLGNPPYSGESQNKGKLDGLLDDYKEEPGTTKKLDEKNSKWLNDDYVKFIRYGQYFIEKNKEGVLAFINNHSFLDNPTFRGMRYKLLEAFDKIYIIDLHGNSKKRELSPDGSKDVNVFDIQQGVSINIFVKAKDGSNDLAKVYHYDLYGERQYKYDYLLNNKLNTVPYRLLAPKPPYYFFVKKDFELEEVYNKGFYVKDLFIIDSTGIITGHDHFVIDYSKDKLKDRIKLFFTSAIEDIVNNLNLDAKRKYFNIETVKSKTKYNEAFIKAISYRPFDRQYVYYDKTYFIEGSRYKVMEHFIKGDNLGLALCKQFKTGEHYLHAFITDQITESSFVSNRTSEITYIYPLYLYSDTLYSDTLYSDTLYSDTSQNTLDGKVQREPNFNMSIVKDIAKRLKFRFVNEKENNDTTFAPIDILDYIYAVLHSPSYRDRYKEFLKIDFPRVPYPEDSITFWKLVDLGKRIRELHLLESKEVSEYITSYSEGGSNIVEKLRWEYIDKDYDLGRVWINGIQYFDKVPLVAYEFYIGGYQPAQKWLKDRKGRKLSYDDIAHYQKIIVALYNTHKLMAEVDPVLYPVI